MEHGPNFQKPKEEIVQLEKIWRDGFENIQTITTPQGFVSLGTDIGVGRTKNEDRLFIDTEHGIYAVVDGMGGYDGGAEAADFVAEQIGLGVKAGTEPEKFLGVAAKNMRDKTIWSGGACYTYAQLDKKTVNLAWAGDTQALIINSSGEVKYFSEPTPLDEAVRGISQGKTTRDVVDFLNGETLVLGSDGLWENISFAMVARIVRESFKKGSKNTDVVLKEIFNHVTETMRTGFYIDETVASGEEKKKWGARDNISIIVFHKSSQK